MIKKIIIFSILTVIASGIGYAFYLSNELGKLAPDLMEAAEHQFIETCEFEFQCINAIEESFEDCYLDNYVSGINLFNFQEKYMTFMLKTHKCIEEKSNYELPSFMDFWMEQKLAEIENNDKKLLKPHDRKLTGNENFEELLLYKSVLGEYESYQDEAEHKAFAVNGLGIYGWSVNYESESVAVQQALKYCEESNKHTQSKCFVVDINSEFVYPYKGKP